MNQVSYVRRKYERYRDRQNSKEKSKSNLVDPENPIHCRTVESLNPKPKKMTGNQNNRTMTCHNTGNPSYNTGNPSGTSTVVRHVHQVDALDFLESVGTYQQVVEWGNALKAELAGSRNFFPLLEYRLKKKMRKAFRQHWEEKLRSKVETSSKKETVLKAETLLKMEASTKPEIFPSDTTQNEHSTDNTLGSLLNQNPDLKNYCTFTSLPDICELQCADSDVCNSITCLETKLIYYKVWFVNAVKTVLINLPNDSVSVFYQTPIRWEFNQQVDKSGFVNQGIQELNDDLMEIIEFANQGIQGLNDKSLAAHQPLHQPLPLHLVWHKICLIKELEYPVEIQSATRSTSKPTAFSGNSPKFTHVLCVRKGEPQMSDYIRCLGEWSKDIDTERHVKIISKAVELRMNPITMENELIYVQKNGDEHTITLIKDDSDDGIWKKDKLILKSTKPDSIALYYSRYSSIHNFDNLNFHLNRHYSSEFTPQDISFRGQKPTQIRNRTRCMGLDFTIDCLEYLRKCFTFSAVFDPFCGAGTVLAVAEKVGFTHSIGCDVSIKRVKQSRKLTIVTEREPLLEGKESKKEEKAKVVARQEGRWKEEAHVDRKEDEIRKAKENTLEYSKAREAGA